MPTLINATGPGAELSTASIGYLSKSVDLSAATWKSIASHEVFTVTGLVRVRTWVECTVNVTSTGGAATLQYGVAGTTDGFITATDENAIDAVELWYDTSPTTNHDTFANVVFDYVVNGLDIGYEIADEATTAGTLVFHLVYEPLNSTGLVVVGAGGTL